VHLPITVDFRQWWAPTGLLGVPLVLVPALLGFVRATAPQRRDRSGA
jgi:hypothetical protein